MAEQNELSMADIITGQATATPTAQGSRRKSQGLMAKASEETYSVEEVQNDIASYVNMFIDTQREAREPLDPMKDGVSLRPQSYEQVISKLNNPEKAEDLKQDEAFMANLNRMKEKYPGLTENEIFKVIEGESAYNPRAKSKAGAVGLFQMMPEPLSEIGFTPDEVISMEPAEQLLVYEQYLKRWNYDGSTGLGILQAAPAYRNASPDTVIYEKGSKEWKMNKGWRSRGNGDITKRSIEAYYGRVE